jgi:hypothetical protein
LHTFYYKTPLSRAFFGFFCYETRPKIVDLLGKILSAGRADHVWQRHARATPRACLSKKTKTKDTRCQTVPNSVNTRPFPLIRISLLCNSPPPSSNPPSKTGISIVFALFTACFSDVYPSVSPPGFLNKKKNKKKKKNNLAVTPSILVQFPPFELRSYANCHPPHRIRRQKMSHPRS